MDQSGERECETWRLHFFFLVGWEKDKEDENGWGRKRREKGETKKVFLGNVFLEFVKESGQFLKREREVEKKKWSGN